MVKHIVIFKLSPPFTPEERELSVRKLKELFGPVGNRLKYVIEYRTGGGRPEEVPGQRASP